MEQGRSNTDGTNGNERTGEPQFLGGVLSCVVRAKTAVKDDRQGRPSVVKFSNILCVAVILFAKVVVGQSTVVPGRTERS